MRVLIVGHISLDYRDDQVIPGGPPRYQVPVFLAMGAEVTVITSAKSIDNFSVHKNLTIHFIKSQKDTVFQFRKLDNEQSKISNDRELILHSVANPITIKDLGLLIQDQEFDITMISPIINEISENAISFLANKSKYTFLDLQGIVRHIGPDGKITNSISKDLIEKYSRLVDVIKLSDVELSSVNPKRLELNCLLLVTKGEFGGSLFDKNSEIIYSSPKITEIIDSTGSGDIFFAIFAGLFSEGNYLQILDVAAKFTVKNLKYSKPPTLEYARNWIDELLN